MFNVRFGVDYLLYRLKAKTRHGLHSPFVYRLVDEVIYDFNTKKVYPEVEALRTQLLADERQITVTDLGAGSHVNNNKQKRVGDIAKNALKPPHLAQLLYRLVADLQPQNIIELGTCLGTTSVYLQKAAPNAKVYTLEGCPQTAGVAKQTFEKAKTGNIELVVGNFDNTLPGVIDKLDKLDTRILNILQKDSSLSTKDIAQQIGLSVSPTHERIKRLKTEDILKNMWHWLTGKGSASICWCSVLLP